MISAILIIVALLLAYLIGSFPSAYIVGRLRKGVDIRQVGSRNMGAMNVFYKVGFWYGMLVLALDIGKGALAVAVAHWLGTALLVGLAAGILAVLGHNFPVFLGFKGGRGGATCIGVLIYLMPWGAPIYLAIFGLALLFTHFPTLSYSLAFLCFPFIGWLINDSVTLAVYPVLLLLVPGLRYISRVQEMHSTGGGWRRVFMRKNLKDRL